MNDKTNPALARREVEYNTFTVNQSKNHNARIGGSNTLWTTTHIYSSQPKTDQDPNEIDWRKLRDYSEGADNLGDHEVHKTIEEQVIAWMQGVEDGTIDTSK